MPGELHRANGCRGGHGGMTHWAGGWGRSRRGAFKQHQWGKLVLPSHTCISFSLLVTASKYGSMRIMVRGGFGY